ncbi:MAG TPA: four-helix bundle copper-binding protein [Bacteroidia bacterium]|nr:four-helix bundle copper-binding protein [Bacteroidia bacterium]
METKQIIAELYLCAAQCDACYKACLSEEDKKLQRCLDLTEECYEICGLIAKLLEKGSENTGMYLKLCAEICTICAEECRKHHHDHCQKCAEQCRKCSAMCLEYQS